MPAAPVGTLLVFSIILGALISFVTEPLPIDVTAIGIRVTLMLLGPWTGGSQNRKQEVVDGGTPFVHQLASCLGSLGIETGTSRGRHP